MEVKLSNLHKRLEDFSLKLKTHRRGDEIMQLEIKDVLKQIEQTDTNFSDKLKTTNLLSDIIKTLQELYRCNPKQQNVPEGPMEDKPQVETLKLSCERESNSQKIPETDTKLGTNNGVTGASKGITEGDSDDEAPSDSTYGFDKVRRENAARYIYKKVSIWMNHQDFDKAEHPYASIRIAIDLPTSQPKRTGPVSNRGHLSLNKSELTNADLHSEDSRTPKRTTTMSPRCSKRFKEQITRQDFRVAFSRICRLQKEREIVENLGKEYDIVCGGAVVKTVENATVLVAGKLLRTIKILSALTRGVPIVGHNWLEASKKADRFLDPWEYLLQDPKGEDRYAFNLKSSLLKSVQRDRPLLAGFSIFVTENVTPPPQEMKAIIMNCGANFIEKAPDKSWPENSLIISCEQDAFLVKKMKNRPTVVSSEWIMRGILKQRIEYERYELAL